MNKNPAQAEAGPSSSLPVSIHRRQAQQAIVRRAAQEVREEARRKKEARLDREQLADDTSAKVVTNCDFPQAGPSKCQHDNIDDDGLSKSPDLSLPWHSPTPPPDEDFFLQRSPSPGPPPDEEFFPQRSPSPGPPPDEDFFLQRSPSPGPPPPDEDFFLWQSPSLGPPPPDQALLEHHRVAIDVNKLATLAILPKMKDTIEFIHALQNASLDDPCSKHNAAALHHLREPHQASLEINQPAIRFAISEYFALEHSAQDAYEHIHRSAGHCFAGDANEIPSYYQIERLIAEFTGVESIEHDMCPESCIAFTGPFSHLEHCPICGHDRYDAIKLRTSGGWTKVALRKFVTIPLGAQLQALWRDPGHAEKMSHLQNETERIFNLLREHGGQIDVFNDFVMGSDYIHAVACGDITKDDIVLMISMDGAQLYESKQSDCWIYIWIVMNHAPGE
ncbi:hypothetical protein F4604DRAFT_1930593 [Suillus subluteus]|nr:hypothetical protein F4604DRAFT_1930593 [Suillus subluteus]